MKQTDMLAGLQEAHLERMLFYTHEPHFLKSATKLHHLISKNFNLNKAATLLFCQNLVKLS